MIEFNHLDESYFGAMGISPERFQEISRIFREGIPHFQKTSVKSMGLEKLINLIDPKTIAEYLVIGMMIGGHEAHYAAYRKMTEDMRQKFETRDDDVNDF
tara:strand:- start:577 stop:876 length:300 start_codon:yes stop_codon:yes gene_type:complete